MTEVLTAQADDLDLFSEADVEGGSSDEEDVDILKCPKCNHDNDVKSIPHKCCTDGCGFVFEQGPGGFVKDGFVVSDESDTSSVTESEEEEEEEEDYTSSSSEEESEESEEEEEEDSDSDGEWRPKKKAKRSD
jgi:hypothetical protein